MNIGSDIDDTTFLTVKYIWLFNDNLFNINKSSLAAYKLDQ